MPNNIKYRPELDGLRALAVISVILYHSGFIFFEREWFKGGFIGVDIFFVLSGYLISRIIFTELDDTGKLNIKNFFEKRIRRILPPLLLVITLSTPFALMILQPSALVEYSKSIVSSLLFCSNLFFYFTTVEYGAESSLLKPFLHTWSLSVEEQFYLVFPFFAIATQRYFKNSLPILFLVISISSFLIANDLSLTNSEFSFFSIHTRFWEMLTGSILACCEKKYGREFNISIHKILPVIGIIFIIFSIVQFSNDRNHPGFFTLIPVVGTSLVIYFTKHETLIGRLLSTNMMVRIGLISYSLYLWHFPVFAFTRAKLIDHINKGLLLGIILSLILSVITYRYVETPFRNKIKISTKCLLILVSSSAFCIFCSSLAFISNDGNFRQNTSRDYILPNFELDNNKLQKEIYSFIKENESGFTNSKYAHPKLLLVGNSHRRDMYCAILQNKDLLPNIEIDNYVIQINCFAKNEISAENFYKSQKYKNCNAIFLSTRYFNPEKKCIGCSQKHTNSNEIIKGLKNFIVQTKKDGKIVAIANNSIEFSTINNRPISEYFVIQARKQKINNISEIKRNIGLKLYKERNKGREIIVDLNRQILDLTKQFNVLHFDKADYIIDEDSKFCDGITPRGYKIFFNQDHYTLEGAKFLGGRMVEIGWFNPLLKELNKP